MDYGKDLSLLSLDGFAELEQKIIGYVGSGDDGVQSLLNFRQTCSTTKSWVDDLPILHQYKTFVNTRVRLLYSVDNLRNYIAAPPPTGVAAILLTDHNKTCGSEISDEENNLWQQFIEISKDKIFRLQISNHENFPPNGRLLEMLRFKNIKSFRCTSLQFCYDKLEIQKQLLESEEIREFQTRVVNADDLRFLVKLMKVNQERKFYLTVDFRSRQIVRGCPRFREAVISFAKCVVNYSSISVRLLECRPLDLRDVVMSRMGAEAVVEFFKRVESIVNFSTVHGRFWFYYSDFPNLKKVSTAEKISSELEDDWPLQITQMTLNYEVNLNWVNFLPETLTYIKLSFQASPVNEFLQGMMLLSENCPYLTALGVKWICINRDNDEDFCDEIILFEDLRCLMLEMTVPGDVGKDVVRNVAKSLQIDALPLEILQFIAETHDTDPIENVLDEMTLVKWIKGSVSKSLYKFEAEGNRSEVRLEFGPRRLMKKLLATAAENKRRKTESVGKKHVKLRLELDFPQYDCNLLQIQDGNFRFSE